MTPSTFVSATRLCGNMAPPMKVLEQSGHVIGMSDTYNSEKDYKDVPPAKSAQWIAQRSQEAE